MPLEENFKNAADSVRKFTKRPNDADLLELYALYKQATAGDNRKGKPSADKEVKKWDAWNNKKGMDDKRAKELYVEKYKVLASKCA